MNTIRELFPVDRPIDRRIEKVIDYYADDEDRLAAEVQEYEATDNVEACFRSFLEAYQAGAQAGQVTEVGIWVSGFYGSGKSSFTKYLGFALQGRKVHGQAFLDLLADRLRSADVKALLHTVARQLPTAVVMLDLGAEQLAESTAATVTNVLYWKVLQFVGYSKEKKLAQLELTLDGVGLYDGFRAAYSQAYDQEWGAIHNDPIIGVVRASRLLPSFLPDDFPEKDSFSKLRFEMAHDVRDLAKQMMSLIRRHTGRQNILFMLDEAGQYVAPRGELILNLDGLARNLKELGQGKVWIMATGQQTLDEITSRAAYNSPELTKLRDRFPTSIQLDARDIREITYRRLLTKVPEGEAQLRHIFQASGQALVTHTRLTGTSLLRDDPTLADFTRYYPFLPQHFEVLMLLVRSLARSTGGVGLRSAIRVIQDVLVDTSRILPPDQPRLADQKVGTLACVDHFYLTLRADIAKRLPHVAEAVDQAERIFPAAGIHLRVARAVAALQLLEDFPRSAENIAALLYPGLGHPSLLDQVRHALTDLMAAKELGLVEDPQAGGYLFLSSSVMPLQRKRSEFEPTAGDVIRVRNQVLERVLAPQPAAKLENVRDVRAAIRVNGFWLLGDQEEIVFQLDMAPAAAWEERRKTWLNDTAQHPKYENTIIWLFRQDDVAESLLPEVCKSAKVVRETDERTADRDVAQYIRAERTLAARNGERVEAGLREALLAGTFIFHGRPTPVRQVAGTLQAASTGILAQAAREVFHQYHLVKIQPRTNLAAQFLEVERLDRIGSDRDPLHLVVQQGGMPRVDVNHPALAEALRAFKGKVDEAGGGRLTGKAVQDSLSDVPYGWSKDAVRYLMAALLVAGEIEIHTAGQILKTPGPAALEAFKSTQSFNRVGVGLRDSKVSMDVLDRAAHRLQSLFGEDVYPLEDHISIAARKHLALLVEQISALPDRLRLLHLAGEGRAQDLLAELTDLLKGDASDAPSRLGVPDSTIPDDIRWARAATTALNDGGESDVQQAVRLLSDLDDIGHQFPDRKLGLAMEQQVLALQDILTSERFHEQLPDLRGGVRAVRARVHESYVQQLEQFRTSLRQVRTALEARADWLLLSDADREEIVSRLAPALPDAPPDESLLSAYRTLLIRQAGLAGLQGDLESEIDRRQLPLPVAQEGPPTLVEQAVTRLVENEEELARKDKLSYLGVMAGAMAHGLSQPIGIIRAVASASISDLEGGLFALEEAQPRFVKIVSQTDRLAHIVENMRAFARGDWRKREPVDLSQVAVQMCDLFAAQFENRKIHLQCSIESAAPPLMVSANPVQLQEVLISLLTNARDAVEGQPDARVDVRCWRTADGRYALSVQDNGPGLPPQYREHLFTPFVTTKPSEKGTGLGLFTSWRVVADLGGELCYEDPPDSGARFVVHLPPLQGS